MGKTYRGIESFGPVAVALLMVGCGGGDGGADTGGEPASEAPSAEAPRQVENAGTLRGTVNFAGTAPQAPAIDMSEEPTCAEKHGSGGARGEEVVANGGKLKNVFVYVKEGLTGSFPASGDAVVIDQDGCVYKPHVLGIQAGQKLSIKNSDGLLHNIKTSPKTNRGFNISQPRNMTTERTFQAKEVMIPVECDVHNWMKAYIGVVDHPYYAVSSDDGTFTIGNLPPGNYVVEAWHEKLGTQTANVTVGPNETKDVQFNYTQQMAENAVVPLGKPIDLHDHGSGGQGHVAMGSGR